MVGGQLARRYSVPYRSSNVSAANARRRPGGLRVRVLAVGRDHGRRQPADARRGLDGGRAPRRVREGDPRRRAARDGRGVPRPGRRSTRTRWRSRRCEEVGPGGHFFGAAAHPVAVPDRVPQADALGLAELRVVGGGGLAAGARQGEPDLEGAARRLRAAADGPGVARGARRVRRPPQGRGRRPDGLTDVEESCEVVCSGRRHRWRRRRRQRPVPPDEGRLDRRPAPRAARADGRLHLARGRRHAHPQRRPERRPAPAVHDPAVRADREGVRPGLLDPPAGRPDARQRRDPDGLPADGRRPRPLPRDAARDDLARRRRATSSRCSTRSTSSARCTTTSRATSTRPASPGPTSSAPRWPARRSASTRR